MAATPEQFPGRTDGPPIENLQFMERARAVFDDYSATMRDAIPNLGHKINLKDFDGIEWTVSARIDENQEIRGIVLGKAEGIFQDRPSRGANLSKFPFGSFAVGLGLYEPEQVLEFVERKMKELLGPIKAAQVLRSVGQ